MVIKVLALNILEQKNIEQVEPLLKTEYESKIYRT